MKSPRPFPVSVPRRSLSRARASTLGLLAAGTSLTLGFGLVLGGAACGSSSSNSVPIETMAASIGPAGGTVSLPSGAASVVIPAGALTAATMITITTAPSAPAPDVGTEVSTPVTFGPDGTVFAIPVSVTLAFDTSNPASSPEKALTVYTARDGSSEYETLTTTIADSSHVTASTTHFSTDVVVSPDSASSVDGGHPSIADASHDVTVVEAGPISADGGSTFCALPGSVRFTADGITQVAGGAVSPSLAWLTLPNGYCAHYFGNVGNARQIRFSPSGDLFVASPTEGTTGGGSGGLAAYVVLPDDDGDGFADTTDMFLPDMPASQAILFANGSFYFQDSDPTNTQGQVGTLIRKIPYTNGQRSASISGATTVANINEYYSATHWPKTLDIADDGTIYVGNGGDQSEQCSGTELTSFPRPFHGGILKIDGTANGTPVAQGFRNPIAVKCQRGHDHCFSTELSLDYSGAEEGREKLVPIRQGDDWGYPCCATADTKYTSVSGNPNCSQVAADSDSFIIGHTPFGFDFTPPSWSNEGMWNNRVFVALHGVFGTWEGARVVGIALDPTTGQPLPSTELDGGTPATMSDFVTGYDDGERDHGRPADITFAPDGRMFLANDDNGDILWIAPMDLADTKVGSVGGDE